MLAFQAAGRTQMGSPRLPSPRGPPETTLCAAHGQALWKRWRHAGQIPLGHVSSPRSPVVRAAADAASQSERGLGSSGSGSSGRASGPAAAVTFKVCRHLKFGQALKVVGDLPQLGSWDCAAAPAMTWSEGDQWLLSLDLPPGQHEFKLVVARSNAKEGSGADWEPGPNRTLQVPAVEAAAHGAFTVVCEWGNTAASMETLPEDELGMELPLSESESDEGLLRPEDLSAEPYAANGDEGEEPVRVLPPDAQSEGEEEEESEADTKAEGKAAPEGKAGTAAHAAPPQQVGKMTVDTGSSSPSPPTLPTPPGAKAATASPPPPPLPVKEAGKVTAAEQPAATKPAAAQPATPAGKEGKAPPPSPSPPPAQAAPGAPVKMEAGDYPSQTPMGEGADVALGGEPAGSLKPSTEAAVKKELQQAAVTAAQGSQPGKPGLFARLLQALTGGWGASGGDRDEYKHSADEDKEDSDDEDGGKGGSSGGSSSGPTGTPRAGGGSSSAARPKGGTQPPQQPPSASASASASASPAASGELPPPPGSGMQLAVSAAGLVALPVVAWSEWVLKSTGCGLPPGPNGLLGAAEGISYLVVGSVVLWSLSRKLSTGSGLPAGPAGTLGAVEGGSWLAVLSGLVVLALQWQTYGYIPSALPDNNCFGEQATTAGYTTAGYTTAQAPASSASRWLQPRSNSDQASAPEPGSSPAPADRSLRFKVGGAPLPQGNLLFSVETAISQSGSILETAETAAAAMAAAAAGQPPPQQVSAALQQLQQRAVQAQQLFVALSRGVLDNSSSGGSSAAAQQVQQVAAAAAAAGPDQAPTLEPLDLKPPRHKVRAALHSSLKALSNNQTVRAMLEPYPLPAVARQAAAAAGGALEAVGAGVDASLGAIEREEEVAAGAARQVLREIRREASWLGGQLQAALPEELRAWVAPAPAPSPALPAVEEAAKQPKQPKQQHQQQPQALAQPQAAQQQHGGNGAAATAAAAAKTGSAADAARPDPAHRSASDMLDSVFSDLKEGYVGLWHSALEFDPEKAAADLQRRLHEQQAAQLAAQLAAQPAGQRASPAAAATSTAATPAKPAAAAAPAAGPSPAATISAPAPAPAPAPATMPAAPKQQPEASAALQRVAPEATMAPGSAASSAVGAAPLSPLPLGEPEAEAQYGLQLLPEAIADALNTPTVPAAAAGSSHAPATPTPTPAAAPPAPAATAFSRPGLPVFKILPSAETAVKVNRAQAFLP